MSKKRLMAIVATRQRRDRGGRRGPGADDRLQRRRGLRRGLQQQHRLHRRPARLLPGQELDREVVDAVRGAQHRRLRRLAGQRRLRRRYGGGGGGTTCNYPNWAAGHLLPGRLDRAVHERQLLPRQVREPGLRPDHQHLVLGAVHLLRRWRRHHRPADQPAGRRLPGQRGPVQPDVPEPELVLLVRRVCSTRSASTRRSPAPAATPSASRRPRRSWPTPTTRPAAWSTSPRSTRATTSVTRASRTAARPARTPTTAAARSS